MIFVFSLYSRIFRAVKLLGKIISHPEKKTLKIKMENTREIKRNYASKRYKWGNINQKHKQSARLLVFVLTQFRSA
jgi:hypothetical protein